MSKPSEPDPNSNPYRAAPSLDSIPEETSPQPPQILLHRLWHHSLESARKFLKTFQQSTIKATGWFQVDEDKLSQLLDEVRTALSTTEVFLIGKPQTGKSSIIRGLTGISAEVVGQGFRPHTTHTQRYNYPTDDLPLLIFTDTVGLGEGPAKTVEVIQELTGELRFQRSQALRQAKVLIVVLTALQVTLVTLLGRLYGQTLRPSQTSGVLSAIAGGFIAQLVGRELVRFIPGGSVVVASWAAAYT